MMLFFQQFVYYSWLCSANNGTKSRIHMMYCSSMITDFIHFIKCSSKVQFWRGDEFCGKTSSQPLLWVGKNSHRTLSLAAFIPGLFLFLQRKNAGKVTLFKLLPSCPLNCFNQLADLLSGREDKPSSGSPPLWRMKKAAAASSPCSSPIWLLRKVAG